MTTENKKLSYSREIAHLTSLNRTVHKAFGDVERSGVNHECDRKTERPTDKWTDRVKPIGADTLLKKYHGTTVVYHGIPR